MATSYFEEHDVEGHDNDRQDEESSDSRMLLGLARRLLESGYFLQVKKQKNLHWSSSFHTLVLFPIYYRKMPRAYSQTWSLPQRPANS